MDFSGPLNVDVALGFFPIGAARFVPRTFAGRHLLAAFAPQCGDAAIFTGAEGVNKCQTGDE